MSPSIAVFADSEVGPFCLKWLAGAHKQDIGVVVTTGHNEIIAQPHFGAARS